jgi:hypothetical protein
MFSIIVSAAAEGDDGGSQAQGPPGYGQAVSLCRSVTVPLETVMSIAMEAFFVAVMSVLIGADDMGIRDGRALFTFMTGFGRFDTVLGRFHLSFGCFNPAFQFGLPAGQLLLAFPDFRLLPLQFPLLFGCLASLVVIRLRRCFGRPQEKLGLGRGLHVGDVPDAFFIDPDVDVGPHRCPPEADNEEKGKKDDGSHGNLPSDIKRLTILRPRGNVCGGGG